MRRPESKVALVAGTARYVREITRTAALLASEEASCAPCAPLVFDGGRSSVLPGPLT
ncbi:hypothetical protein ACLQ2N_29085 [Streptomyces sp. DT224]|uniref:hypothetical protein n=1 Tax=Streptomyces sp. DT224 TaxID=3393426 RepID=UPI003CEF9396